MRLGHTRALRNSAVGEQHKSAVTDHVTATNHAINWDDTKIIVKEGHKTPYAGDKNNAATTITDLYVFDWVYDGNITLYLESVRLN